MTQTPHKKETQDAIVTVVDTPPPFDTVFAVAGIAATTYRHARVFTVEESRDIKAQLPGGHTKNLFLKDKRGDYWLVTAHVDTVIDLKALAAHLGAGRFSFGKAESLLEKLGVTPGSVTALAVINDTGRVVRPVMDKALTDYDLVNCHPLMNDKTTALSPAALLDWMRSLGYTPVVVDFTAMRTI